MALNHDPYKDTRYASNFLKEVIARVDFLSPLPGVETALPVELSNIASRNFRIAEPRDAVQQQVQLGPAGISEPKERRFKEWYFHGKQRTKRLAITPDWLHVLYEKYETYDLLRSEFMEVVERIDKVFAGVQVKRTGLRYINSIELRGEPDPLDWSAYLNPDLLSLFRFPDQARRHSLCRVFHTIDFAFESFNLSYRLGMHNPDYPAPIRKKIFVLDLDAHTELTVETKDVGALLDQFHEAIQEYFESSITPALRSKMNGD